MNWDSIQKFFRENPRAWFVAGAAVLVLVLSVWGIWGNFSLQYGRSSAEVTQIPFTVTPSSVAPGGTVRITWNASTSSATSCITTAGSFDGTALVGDENEAISPNATAGPVGFGVDCKDADGVVVAHGEKIITISTATPQSPQQIGGPVCPGTDFWTIEKNEEWSPECIEGQSNITNSSAFYVKSNVVACHPHNLHLNWRASHRNSAGCSTSLPTNVELSEGNGITTSVTGFDDMTLEDGEAGTARMNYLPASFNCGSIYMNGGFLEDGSPINAGYHFVFSYGVDCAGGGGGGGGGSCPVPPADSQPATLSVTCGATQNVLRWQNPRTLNASANSVIRNDNGADGAFIFQEGGCWNTFGISTFTDTSVQPGHVYNYRVKTSDIAVSNTVTCPGSGATPTPTPTPTATPTAVFPQLQCSPVNQSVALQQIATVNATGGNGTYQWELSGSGIQQAGTATSVGVSYSVSGQKVVRVSSAGQIATCVVTVTGTGGTAQSLISVTKLGLNTVTGAGSGASAISVNPNEIAQFTLSITNNGTTIANGLRVLDTLPVGMSYRFGSTTVNGQAESGNTITSAGLSLESLAPGANVNIQWSAIADTTGQITAGSQQSQPRVFVTAIDTSGATADMSVTVFGSGFAGTGTGTGTGAAGGNAGGVATGPGDAVTIALVMAAALTLLYSGYTRSPAYRRKEADTVSQDQGPMDFRS